MRGPKRSDRPRPRRIRPQARDPSTVRRGFFGPSCGAVPLLVHASCGVFPGREGGARRGKVNRAHRQGQGRLRSQAPQSLPQSPSLTRARARARTKAPPFVLRSLDLGHGHGPGHVYGGSLPKRGSLSSGTHVQRGPARNRGKNGGRRGRPHHGFRGDCGRHVRVRRRSVRHHDHRDRVWGRPGLDQTSRRAPRGRRRRTRSISAPTR